MAGGIVVILCGLLCLYANLPALIYTAVNWHDDTTISRAESQGVDWVLTHAYPNSAMIRADAGTWNWSAGDHATVWVEVTLESADSFDAIMSWYIQHPEGVRLVREGYYGTLLEVALEKLDGADSGKTRYRVTYESIVRCFNDCDIPSRQIR